MIGVGDTVSTAQSTLGLTRLNILAKQLQGSSYGAPGVPVHTRQRITLLLAKGQQRYLIGPAATDSRSSTLMGRTTVSSAYASGTSLAVTAITDTTSYPGTTISMTTGDFIGVQLDDGTIGYTTLNGTPGSSPVTLQAGLASAASVGNYVYWFTSRAQRFPVLEAAVLRNSNNDDQPLNVFKTVQDYQLGVVAKFSPGDPTSILVEPLRLNTQITLDSQPSDVTKRIVLTVLYPAEDYDATTNDIAYPQEALGMLSWELSLRQAPAYGVAWTPVMQANLEQARSIWRNLNPEVTDLYFQSAT